MPCERSEKGMDFKMKIKKIICILILVAVSILFVFTLFDFFQSLFVSNFEIVVNNKNRAEINEMIENFCDDPNKINRIRFEVELGDGELRLYNYFHLEKKTIASQSDKIMDYMCENGTSVKGICLFQMLIEIIIFLYVKSVLDYETEQ